MCEQIEHNTEYYEFQSSVILTSLCDHVMSSTSSSLLTFW